MLWLLMLHIAALLVWCAALIYLPVLVAVSPRTRAAFSQPTSYLPSIERFVFTHCATPIALLAIFSGTLIFIVNGTTEAWLIVKLSAVVGMVICHVLLGLLIRRAEMIDWPSVPDRNCVGLPRTFRIGSYLLVAAVCCLIVTVLWLVLAKPTLGRF